jgi:hypothetical protein
MAKLQITLDASKIRPLISEREYTGKDGVVKLQEVKFELVEVKEPKTIYDGDKHSVLKTHFACAIQTKEQRDAKEPTIYVGEGFTTHFKNEAKKTETNQVPQPTTSDDLPF